MALQSLFRTSSYDKVQKTGKDRILAYIRWKRLYDGFVQRKNLLTSIQWKEVEYNLARPIANTAASFFAAQEISFQVSDSEEVSEAANEIWKRSGGQTAFIENALLGIIYGDACVMAVYSDDDQKESKLKWLDPSICFPVFDPKNYEKLETFVIAYSYDLPSGGRRTYYEEWNNGQVVIEEDGDVTGTDTYDPELYEGGIPHKWIRNGAMKGDLFGYSDIGCVAQLVEKYDHLNRKLDNIIDYYSNPNIYMKGVQKSNTTKKDERTIYFLPKDGEIGFIEWKGNPVGVENKVAQVRETISEITETPQVAFSKLDGAVSNVSGVALRLMFQPLMAKTIRRRAAWEPQICKAMCDALRLEGKTVKPEQISMVWQSPLPETELEDWQISEIKDRLGVSKKKILKERGYTEDEIAQMEKEKDEEMEKEQASLGEQAVRMFDRGGAGKQIPKQSESPGAGA